MTGMGTEEAERFHEEDEDLGAVFATFEATEKGHTALPAAGSQQAAAHRGGCRGWVTLALRGAGPT
jgi:hypothetical protein